MTLNLLKIVLKRMKNNFKIRCKSFIEMEINHPKRQSEISKKIFDMTVLKCIKKNQ